MATVNPGVYLRENFGIAFISYHAEGVQAYRVDVSGSSASWLQGLGAQPAPGSLIIKKSPKRLWLLSIMERATEKRCKEKKSDRCELIARDYRIEAGRPRRAAARRTFLQSIETGSPSNVSILETAGGTRKK